MKEKLEIGREDPETQWSAIRQKFPCEDGEKLREGGLGGLCAIQFSDVFERQCVRLWQ